METTGSYYREIIHWLLVDYQKTTTRNGSSEIRELQDHKIAKTTLILDSSTVHLHSPIGK